MSRYKRHSNSSLNPAATRIAMNKGLWIDFIHTSNNSSLCSTRTPSYSVNPKIKYNRKSEHGYLYHVNGEPKIAVISGDRLNKIIASHASTRHIKSGFCNVISLDNILYDNNDKSAIASDVKVY